MTNIKVTKICSVCKETKPITFFSPRQRRCKQCLQAIYKEKYKDTADAKRRSIVFNYESIPDRSINNFISSIHFTDDCWIWLGFRNEDGYGELAFSYRMISAHRFSYLFHFKTLDKDLKVLHTCDNPPCVNPKHLFQGTQVDNMADMVAKGRASKGEQHWYSKLKIVQVVKIKQLLEKKELKQREIAKMFNVHENTIASIKNGATWRHIN